jgi:hypothetical protein
MEVVLEVVFNEGNYGGCASHLIKKSFKIDRIKVEKNRVNLLMFMSMFQKQFSLVQIIIRLIMAKELSCFFNDDSSTIQEGNITNIKGFQSMAFINDNGSALIRHP